MKILYFERETSGHRIPHLLAIISTNHAESVLVVPETLQCVNCKQYVYRTKEGKKRKLRVFLKMLREVRDICEVEKPDIVHFTDGNIFYRFFGCGLGFFKKYKTVLTNHNAEEGFFHAISTWLISHKVDCVAVTCEYSKKVFNRYGANNVFNIEYPHLNDYMFSKREGLNYYGLPSGIPIITCIGGTRYDKGLDIIIDALKGVKKPFHLLIAGNAEDFSEEYIDNNTASYKEKITKKMAFLSEEEFGLAMAAADFVAVPYRRGFNGASGPLGEAVWRRKCVIGPTGNNLGYVIENNHLGYTFEQENSISLRNLLNRVLDISFQVDEKYENYRKMMDYNIFGESYRKIYENLMR